MSVSSDSTLANDVARENSAPPLMRVGRPRVVRKTTTSEEMSWNGAETPLMKLRRGSRILELYSKRVQNCVGVGVLGVVEEEDLVLGDSAGCRRECADEHRAGERGEVSGVHVRLSIQLSTPRYLPTPDDLTISESAQRSGVIRVR